MCENHRFRLRVRIQCAARLSPPYWTNGSKAVLRARLDGRARSLRPPSSWQRAIADDLHKNMKAYCSNGAVPAAVSPKASSKPAVEDEWAWAMDGGKGAGRCGRPRRRGRRGRSRAGGGFGRVAVSGRVPPECVRLCVRSPVPRVPAAFEHLLPRCALELLPWCFCRALSARRPPRRQRRQQARDPRRTIHPNSHRCETPLPLPPPRARGASASVPGVVNRGPAIPGFAAPRRSAALVSPCLFEASSLRLFDVAYRSGRASGGRPPLGGGLRCRGVARRP